MTDLDRVTDLFEKWAAEENEHRQASEYGLAEGLRVAIEDLREAIHGHRAETTTATDEDATVERVADALEHWDRGIDWRLAEQENLTRAAYLRGAEQLLGLLATARTRPTETTTEWGVRHPDQSYAIRFVDKDEAIRVVDATPTLRLVRREVTTWTEADQ